MASEKKLPKEYADRADRIRRASGNFSAEISTLKKKRRELVEKVIKKIDEETIKKIMDSF